MTATKKIVRAAAPFLGLLIGCATPAVVFVSPQYQRQAVRRVALLNFDDFPGQQGSGGMVADVFQKYLIKTGYILVEPNQANQTLQNQNTDLSNPTSLAALGQTLNVDAVVLGSVSELTDSSEQTVMEDIPQEVEEPVYQDVVLTRRNGAQRVVNMQTGTQTNFVDQSVPETEELPARVGFSARLVSTHDGSILWSGSADGDGMDLASAAEDASSKIINALLKDIHKKTS